MPTSPRKRLRQLAQRRKSADRRLVRAGSKKHSKRKQRKTSLKPRKSSLRDRMGRVRDELRVRWHTPVTVKF